MTRAAVELDFFRLEKESSAKCQAPNLFDRRRSFRDIQSALSKINPEILKSVIASRPIENGHLMTSRNSLSVPSTPNEDQNSFPALPLYTPTFRPRASSGGTTETAPLTIFYNGSVVVFDVPPSQAENILKLAQEGDFKALESVNAKRAVSSTDQCQLLETLDGVLPITRRKSLERFLEKRRERLTLASPYGCPTRHCIFSG